MISIPRTPELVKLVSPKPAETSATATLELSPVVSPAGKGWLGTIGERICWLSIGPLDESSLRHYWKGPLRKRRSSPFSSEDLERASRGDHRLELMPFGTPFQQKVWKALMQVPFGTTVSYGQLARRISGSSKQARAVGSAVGANPIAWLIPCHRVLLSSGALGGFRWGTKAKDRLLKWEQGVAPMSHPLPDEEDKHKLEELLFNARRFEDMTRLAGGIAHDLNNLLAPIRMATELLKRKLADPSLDRYVEIIENSTGQARAVVQEILNLAKDVENEESRRIDVNSLLGELETLTRSTFPSSVDLRFIYQSSAPKVEIDPHQLHRAVLNLLTNARDAVNEHGRVTVEVSTHDLEMRVCVGERCLIPGRYICITVSDDGSGIPSEVREKIFDPFYTTKSEDKGTGLGLATVFGIIAHARGFVDLESQEGRGTAFHLFLPEATA